MNEISDTSDKQKNVSKQSHVIKKQIKKTKLRSPKGRSKMKKRKYQRKVGATIYIGHIPHGFYEDEMNAYFSQFGKVHAVNVVRSKKTGRSKGYAFVEFEQEEVAKIAAETMNNYLMFNKVLKCKYIPPEERKKKMFIRKMYPVLPKVKNRISDCKNKKMAFEALDQESYQKKTQKKMNEFKKFFEERGIEFTFNA